MTGPIAWIGNLGGVGYQYVRILNASGAEARLYLPRRDCRRSRQGNPEHEWEGASRVGFVRPFWRRLPTLGLNRLGILGRAGGWEGRIGRECAVVQAQTCDEIAALRIQRRYGLPYAGMATGSDLSEVAGQETRFAHLYRAALESAEHVFLVNIDQFDTVQRLNLRLRSFGFLPFSVDFGRLRAVPNQPGPRLVLFSAARLDWTSPTRTSLKANDVFFRGFARYSRRPGAAPILVRVADWGPDRQAARALVAELGIGHAVEFVPFGNKAAFAAQVVAANLVIDQFHLGATGLTAIEAMALGRPVMAYCNQALAMRAYGEPMPVINCATEDEVADSLSSLSAEGLVRQSEDATAWALRMHGDERVARMLLQVYGRMAPPGAAPARRPAPGEPGSGELG